MTSNEIRLQVPAMAVYQSALSEAAHKVTSRRGWPPERVERFVSLTDLATKALCTTDASSIELVIDRAGDGLQATLSGIGGQSAAAADDMKSFQTAAKANADRWNVGATSRMLSFRIS